MARQTAPTRHVRVYQDLAEKLGEIIDVSDEQTAADILDPLIREPIEALHKSVLPAIEIKRKANEAVKQLRDEKPVLANEFNEGK